ncbi:hypothetical protein MGS_04622 [Candida albicans P78042]|nr:hypothetical protein MG7_04598 [Candida albicans P34048]KHC64061.1 hypothetical protein MGI_04577 [Candida albicans P75016]KHC71590.1 hypothetical protein MGS_04622 [Candida albicans P78042]RLP65786.1 hypothetical protein L150_04561 [Candida albicans Ca529L]
MAPKVREDLVIPYKHVPVKPRKDSTGVIAQSLPMAAMFMRNKVLSWSALFLTVQSYLNEPINKPDADDGSQPPFVKIVFALVSVLTCYMDVFFPNTNPALRMAAKVATETPAAPK